MNLSATSRPSMDGICKISTTLWKPLSIAGRETEDDWGRATWRFRCEDRRQSSSVTNIAVCTFVFYCFHFLKKVNNNINKNNTNFFLGAHVIPNVQLVRVSVLVSKIFLVWRIEGVKNSNCHYDFFRSPFSIHLLFNLFPLTAGSNEMEADGSGAINLHSSASVRLKLREIRDRTSANKIRNSLQDTDTLQRVWLSFCIR